MNQYSYSCGLFKVMLLVVCLLLVVAHAACAETIFVRPNNMNGWRIGFQSSYAGYPVGEFAGAVPSTPPSGSGAFRIQTENPYMPGDPIQKVYIGTNRHSGVLLKDITKFKYYTYLQSRAFEFGYVSGKPQPGGEPPVIEIITDSGTSSQQRRFQYHPYGWKGDAHVELGAWQEWDLLASNDGHYHWQMVYVDPSNQWGDWYWVWHRYDAPNYNMKLATPLVGDVLDGYPNSPYDWSLCNQSGCSLNIRVGGAKASYKTYEPGTTTLLQPWQLYRESAGINGYADKLVIEVNGVEYVYDFEADEAPSVGINNKAAKDPIIGQAASNFAFVVWGKVLEDPWPDATVFYLDDGSGPIKVLSLDNLVFPEPGQYWRAEGHLDNTTNPPTLTCRASYLHRLR